MVALVGLGDQFVDLAFGDLRQNAVAFADRQQDGVQHFIHTLDQFAVRAIEQGGAPSLGQASLLGGIRQAHDLVQQGIAVVLRCNVFAVLPVTVICAVRFAGFAYQCR